MSMSVLILDHRKFVGHYGNRWIKKFRCGSRIGLRVGLTICFTWIKCDLVGLRTQWIGRIKNISIWIDSKPFWIKFSSLSPFWDFSDSILSFLLLFWIKKIFTFSIGLSIFFLIQARYTGSSSVLTVLLILGSSLFISQSDGYLWFQS